MDRQPQTISHLKIVEPLEVDMEVSFDTFNGPGQGHTSDQQDEEDNIGHCRCDVHHLRHTHSEQTEGRIMEDWSYLLSKQ